MDSNLLFEIALTKIPTIGDIQAKAMVQVLGSAEAVFKTPARMLEKIEGIGKVRADAIKRFRLFKEAEQEIKFINKNNIQALFFTSENYPKRLLNCADSPIMLYYKGVANLNNNRIISVAGTRNHTHQGQYDCEKLIKELSEFDLTIVSGLAYGIDTVAHKSALANNLPTIGVLAHGLQTLYPSVNEPLSKEMLKQGGLLTEFSFTEKPDKQNFPKRNRITAGICDALVVVESGIKGGSLITAEIANSYHRDVFAFPGRTNDSKSEGCNELIKSHKAQLITSAKDIVNLMRWENYRQTEKPTQLALFENLNDLEKKIVELLCNEKTAHVDTITDKCKCNSNEIAGALLSLEMMEKITALPGKMYRLTR
jgi:DNA processing protein